MRTLTVCGTPIAAYTIVTPSDPHPAVTTAAEFLQSTIQRACGVTLPITTEPTDHSIMLGTREPSPDVKWDGFRMSADTANLYLDGNIPRGTLYAAYDFAETYLGYRMFAPDCESIPTEGEADVPRDLDCVDNPAFEVRRTTCHQHLQSDKFSAFSRLNDCMPCGEELGGGVGLTGACHTFDALCPHELYFKEHPEYYALRDGKRIPCSNKAGHAQLCLTNPDVLRIVTENILDQLRANPDTPIVELSQCDNEDYCTCETCAAVDAEEGGPTGTMIRFVNAVAEAVEKEFPNVLVRTFAYAYTRKPPKKTKARHNVLIRYCTIEACFRHALNDPACQRNSTLFYKEMHEWQKMCSQMSVWDYIVCWRAFIPPFPNLISLRENVKFFHQCGAVHLFEECNGADNAGGTTPELKAYLIGKLMWNPYMTEEEYGRHIAEFLRGFYGKGWREICRYLEMEYRYTEGRCFGGMDLVDTSRRSYGEYTPVPYQEILPDNYLSDLAAHYDEAMAHIDRAYDLAETDTERYRIDGIRLSLRYMEICCVEHDREKMTAEERAAHEAAVKQLDIDKEARNFHYNLSTNNNYNR